MEPDEMARRVAEFEARLLAELNRQWTMPAADYKRALLATVVEQAHRAGVPVVRAYFDAEGAIVMEHARPLGHG